MSEGYREEVARSAGPYEISKLVGTATWRLLNLEEAFRLTLSDDLGAVLYWLPEEWFIKSCRRLQYLNS